MSGTVGKTTLTVEQLASHAHGITVPSMYAGTGTEYSQWVGTQGGTTGSTGGSRSHTHTLSGSSGAADSLPPYYALALIMRIA